MENHFKRYAEIKIYDCKECIMTAPKTHSMNSDQAYVELKSHHHKLLELCDCLERVADDLPELSSRQECLVLCRDIFPRIKSAHEFEEKALFPLLHEQEQGNESLDKNLERLRYEHWEDESFAEEISDVFRTYIENPEQKEAEKLAYMLRGFFEGIRRHIAFEQEYILPRCKTTRITSIN